MRALINKRTTPGALRGSRTPTAGTPTGPHVWRSMVLHPLVVAGLVVSTAVAPVACSGSEGSTASSSYSGYVVDPPVSVADVTLPTTDGTEFPMVARPDGLALVYFGYTYCPDVCPTTMSDLRRALGELPDGEADRVDVAMVTIDPARDSAEVLEGYVGNFIADATALRTDDPELLRSAADAFGADYAVEQTPDGEFEVSHTGEVYAVDDSGTVVMQWPFGTGSESLARDLESLLSQATEN